MAQKKKNFNWRASNQITAEVQADLRRKGIFINSKRVLSFKLTALQGVTLNGKTRFRSVL